MLTASYLAAMCLFISDWEKHRLSIRWKFIGPMERNSSTPGWQQTENTAFAKGKNVPCRRRRSDRRTAGCLLTSAMLVLCAAPYSRAQGMSAGFSGTWHLAPTSNEKTASQLLAELRSARLDVAAQPRSAEAHFNSVKRRIKAAPSVPAR